MNDIEKLNSIFAGDNKVVCLLAPSFPACFKYPDIVFKLKKIGFNAVLELTFGAKIVNQNYQKIIKEFPDRTWISSACPTLVALIRKRFSHLKRNLLPVLSPMGATMMIAKKFYPHHKIVFIGPCITKKIEAKEIGIDLALTFKEIQPLVSKIKIDDNEKKQITFDKFYNDYTKIYPIAGGLSKTIKLTKILKENEILVEDGIEKVVKILERFQNGFYKHYRFLDVLACPAGCIGGPGMCCEESIDERRKKILNYRNFSRRHERDLGRRGKMILVDDLDFSYSY